MDPLRHQTIEKREKLGPSQINEAAARLEDILRDTTITSDIAVNASRIKVINNFLSAVSAFTGIPVDNLTEKKIQSAIARMEKASTRVFKLKREKAVLDSRLVAAKKLVTALEAQIALIETDIKNAVLDDAERETRKKELLRAQRALRAKKKAECLTIISKNNKTSKKQLIAQQRQDELLERILEDSGEESDDKSRNADPFAFSFANLKPIKKSEDHVTMRSIASQIEKSMGFEAGTLDGVKARAEIRRINRLKAKSEEYTAREAALNNTIARLDRELAEALARRMTINNERASVDAEYDTFSPFLTALRRVDAASKKMERAAKTRKRYIDSKAAQERRKKRARQAAILGLPDPSQLNVKDVPSKQDAPSRPD